MTKHNTAVCESILQQISELTQPASPPDAWRFLKPVGSIRHNSDDGVPLSAQLKQEFTAEQLVAARVFVETKGGEIHPSPVIADKANQLMVLRRAKESPAFDIVNDKGSVVGSDPPSFDCCRDFFTCNWSDERRIVLATFSDDDRAVLRMLGLPCTPAAGLEGMSGAQAHRLLDEPNAAGRDPRYGQPAAVSQQGRCVTLVAWQVARIINQKPAGLQQTVLHLQKAVDAYGLDEISRVGVWQPSVGHFRRIRSAAAMKDRSQVALLMWQSIARSTYGIRQFLQKEVSLRNSRDYRAACRELQQVVKHAHQVGYHSPEVKKRFEEFNRSFDKSVVDAITNDAMAAPDSMKRSLLLAAAELMQYWHRSGELSQSTKKSELGLFDAQDEVLHPGELKQRLKIVDGLVKIHRELIRQK